MALETPAGRLEVLGDDRVLVTTDDEAFEARRVIVTSGAWTNKLLGGILPLPRLGGPVIVGTGFSGHGFKFTPSVGRILADLAEGNCGAGPLRARALTRR